MNRKGFTLVELLAVIVILAILMVSAGAGVMSTMNNSKINTFKNEMLTAINGAENMYSELYMNTTDYSKYVISNRSTSGTGTGDATYGGMCVTLAGLVNNGHLKKDISTYAGVILIEIPYDGGATKYMVWAHNGTYGINGIEKNNINKLKFQKKNNTASPPGSITETPTEINGGILGIVTELRGIRKVIKDAYGKDDENIVGNPDDLTDGKISIQSSKYHGGTDNVYVNIKCINTKIDTNID